MKKYLLGLFAIALAVGFSAFTTKHHIANKKALFTTYFYTPSSGSGEGSTASYSLNDPGCEGSALPCQIDAPTVDQHIDLDAVVAGTSGQTVLDRIQAADAANTANETVITLKN
jgi:hypothetical protein